MPGIDQIALLGKYEIATVTYADPRIEEVAEVLDTTPTVYITYTIEAEDIPTIEGSLNTPTYHAILYAFGTSPFLPHGASRTITYTGYVDAVEVNTFDTVCPSDWVWSAIGIFPDIVEGAVLTVELSGDVADATYDASALVVYVDSFQVAPDGPVAQVTYSLSAHPVLPFGSVDALGAFHIAHGDLETQLRAGSTIGVIDMEAPYYVGRVHYGGFDPASFGLAGAERLYIQNIAPFGVLFYAVDDITALPDDLKGVPKAYEITHQPVVEVMEGTPVEIPLLSGTILYTYTVDSADLPEVNPPPMRPPMYHLLIAIGGHNDGVSANSIGLEVRKNTIIIESPSGTVDDDTYWTFNIPIADVQDGDVIDIYAYAGNTDLFFDRHARAIMVDELQLAPNDRVLTGVEYVTDTYPVLTIGAPSLEDTGALGITHLDFEAEITGDTSITSQVQKSSLGAGVIYYGRRAQTSVLYTHAANCPQYVNNTVLASVSFRQTDITV